MSMSLSALTGVESRMRRAHAAFGPFASVHEAVGVALEEWDELRAAMHSNDIERVRYEALDLAAVLIRLHDLADQIADRSTHKC